MGIEMIIDQDLEVQEMTSDQDLVEEEMITDKEEEETNILQEVEEMITNHTVAEIPMAQELVKTLVSDLQTDTQTAPADSTPET